MDIKKISLYLIRKRKEYLLTQQILAKKLGVSLMLVIKWESAEILPTANQLEQLADIYEVTVQDIIESNLNAEAKPSLDSIMDKYSGESKDDVQKYYEFINPRQDKEKESQLLAKQTKVSFSMSKTEANALLAINKKLSQLTANAERLELKLNKKEDLIVNNAIENFSNYEEIDIEELEDIDLDDLKEDSLTEFDELGLNFVIDKEVSYVVDEKPKQPTNAKISNTNSNAFSTQNISGNNTSDLNIMPESSSLMAIDSELAVKTDTAKTPETKIKNKSVNKNKKANLKKVKLSTTNKPLAVFAYIMLILTSLLNIAYYFTAELSLKANNVKMTIVKLFTNPRFNATIQQYLFIALILTSIIMLAFSISLYANREKLSYKPKLQKFTVSLYFLIIAFSLVLINILNSSLEELFIITNYKSIISYTIILINLLVIVINLFVRFMKNKSKRKEFTKDMKSDETITKYSKHVSNFDVPDNWLEQ